MTIQKSLFIFEVIRYVSYKILRISQDQVPVSVIFQSDNISFQASRKFTKIGDVLSYLGGILQFFLLIFGAIIIPYNNSFLKLRLANKLYDFKEEQISPERQSPQKDNNLVLSTFKTPGIEENIKGLQSNDLINYQKTYKIEFETRKDFLFHHFNRLIFEKNKITLSVNYLLHTILCKKFHKIKKNDMICSAYQKIDDDMNVRHILNQSIQLDNLKRLILTNQQVVLFDSLPKCLFTLKKQRIDTQRSQLQFKKMCKHRQRRRKIEKYEDHNSFEVILHAFDKIMKNATTQETSQEINKRLVILLGPELKSNLQQSLQVKEKDEFHSLSLKPIVQEQDEFKFSNNEVQEQDGINKQLPIIRYVQEQNCNNSQESHSHKPQEQHKFINQQFSVHELLESDEFNMKESPIQINQLVNHQRINYPSPFLRVNIKSQDFQMEIAKKQHQQIEFVETNIPDYNNKK